MYRPPLKKQRPRPQRRIITSVEPLRIEEILKAVKATPAPKVKSGIDEYLFLRQVDELTARKIGDIVEKLNDTLAKSETAWTTAMDSAMSEFEEQIEELSEEIPQLREALIRDLKGEKGEKGEKGDVGVGKNGKDGKDGKNGKDGKDAILEPETITEMVEKSDAFQELKKTLENLKATLRNVASKQAMGGGQGSWKQKTLTGTINGSNTVFTFSGEAPAEYSERVFLNYVEQNPFTDYTIAGTTVTYVVAPDASLSGFPHIIRYM